MSDTSFSDLGSISRSQVCQVADIESQSSSFSTERKIALSDNHVRWCTKQLLLVTLSLFGTLFKETYFVWIKTFFTKFLPMIMMLKVSYLNFGCSCLTAASQWNVHHFAFGCSLWGVGLCWQMDREIFSWEPGGCLTVKVTIKYILELLGVLVFAPEDCWSGVYLLSAFFCMPVFRFLVEFIAGTC